MKRRRVTWSRQALADLTDQLTYIAPVNPDAARRVARSVRAAGDGLAEFATGHPGRVVGTHEKSVARLPYILVYTLDTASDTVLILRVIHTARNWPD